MYFLCINLEILLIFAYNKNYQNVCSSFATLTHVYNLSLVHVGQQRPVLGRSIHMGIDECRNLIIGLLDKFDNIELLELLYRFAKRLLD